MKVIKEQFFLNSRQNFFIKKALLVAFHDASSAGLASNDE